MYRRSKLREFFRKPSKQDRVGYIVLRADGFTLGHDMTWYNHTTLERAFVHTEEAILARGDWDQGEIYLIKAKYNCLPYDNTEILSAERTPLTDFRERRNKASTGH